MSGRLNYYFRQKVTEAELDLGFALLETAERNLIVDTALTGVADEGTVTQKSGTPNLSVDISGTGIVYDKAGQRVTWTGTQNVDVSVDEASASTTVTTPGNSRIVSVFAKFKRVLTDPRTDGNAATVFFDEAESFEFIVRQGAEAVSPTAPPLDPTYILLADVTLAFGTTQVFNGGISITRREDTFVATSTPRSIRQGQAKDAVTDLLGHYNAHVLGSQDKHPGSDVVVAISNTWADATGITAVDADGAIEEVVADLAATTGDVKVGAPTRAASVLFGLASGSVGSQLLALQGLIDIGTRGRKNTAVNNAASPYSLLSTDRQVNVDTAGGAVSLQLPAPANGIEFYVKDSTGNWGTNNVTLVRAAAEKIEGLAASRVFAAAWGSFRVYSDGTDWFIG